MIRFSFHDLSKSAFIPLYEALVRPHLEYGMTACSPNLVAFGANSKISYKVGNWHSSPPLRRETAADGHSFLEAATTSVQPDYFIQDIHRSLRCWWELVFFSLPLHAAQECTLTKYEAPVEGGGRPFRWVLLNTGISSRLPSVQLLLPIREKF